MLLCSLVHGARAFGVRGDPPRCVQCARRRVADTRSGDPARVDAQRARRRSRISNVVEADAARRTRPRGVSARSERERQRHDPPDRHAEEHGARLAARCSQPLIAPSAFPLLAQAKHNLDAQHAQTIDDKRQLAFDAAKAYFAVLLAQAGRRRGAEEARHRERRRRRHRRAVQGAARELERRHARADQPRRARCASSPHGSRQLDDRVSSQLGFIINAPAPTHARAADRAARRRQEARRRPPTRSSPEPRRAARISLARKGSALAAHDFAREPRYALLPDAGAASASSPRRRTRAQSGHDVDGSIQLAASWSIYDAGARYADKRSRDAAAEIADLQTRSARRARSTPRSAPRRAQLAAAQAALAAAQGCGDAPRQERRRDRDPLQAGPREGDRARRRQRAALRRRGELRGGRVLGGERVPRAAPGDGPRPARGDEEMTHMTLRCSSCLRRRVAARRPTPLRQAASAAAAAASSQYPVEVAPLEVRQMQYTVNAPGSIDAFQQVQITARVAGAVDKVDVRRGPERQGGRRARRRSRASATRSRSTQAKSTLAKAQATQKSAEAALDRRLEAQKESPGLVPGEEIEQKQTAVDTAKADVDAARAGAAGRPAQPARLDGARADRRRRPDAHGAAGPVPAARRGARDDPPARSAAAALPGHRAGRAAAQAGDGRRRSRCARARTSSPRRSRSSPARPIRRPASSR